MTPRTIRRAMERKARKQARKEADKSPLAAVSATATDQADYLVAEREALTAQYESTKATLQQLQANRRNAQLSTGPRTAEGKAASSRNALKTGLTGKTVLLADEDAALYQHHVETFRNELKPVGDRETELTQSIADAKWRLARIPNLEFGIYALGRLQFGEEFANYPRAEAAALIEAKTFLNYQRQLNNLSIQEARLRRQCEKDSAELTRLQQQRARAKAELPKPQPALDNNKIGFVFSTPLSCAAEPSAFEQDLELLTRLQAA